MSQIILVSFNKEFFILNAWNKLILCIKIKSKKQLTSKRQLLKSKREASNSDLLLSIRPVLVTRSIVVTGATIKLNFRFFKGFKFNNPIWILTKNSFKPIIKYIDDQFERFLNDESGLNRRNISDNRAHCCFYFIAPWGHGYVVIFKL